MDKRRVNVHAIVWCEDKIPAAKHRTSKSEALFWCVPEGGLDPYESLIDGVKRELCEGKEINVKVD